MLDLDRVFDLPNSIAKFAQQPKTAATLIKIFCETFPSLQITETYVTYLTPEGIELKIPSPLLLEHLRKHTKFVTWIDDGLQSLVIKPKGVQLSDVPADWKDLVETEIREGRLVLSSFANIDALERHIDRIYTEGPDGAEDWSELQEVEKAFILPMEERETLAALWGLDPLSFTTKQQAEQLRLKARQV